MTGGGGGKSTFSLPLDPPLSSCHLQTIGVLIIKLIVIKVNVPIGIDWILFNVILKGLVRIFLPILMVFKIPEFL